jgi:hypothetical protein
MKRVFTYPDLVRRLYDLERLMLRPPVGERAGLASSYDRASAYVAEKDQYVHWGANADGTGVVRMEGEQAVLAEMEGPGCVWRMWAATVGTGRVRIYLDGSETPAIDLPFSGYFDRQHAPFNRPSLVYLTSALGYNNYTPIPFQKSCRIVADKDWGKYFHFNYTRFAPETQVPTFALPLGADGDAALDRAEAVFAAAGEQPPVAGERVENRSVVLAAGQQITVAQLTGPGVIRALRMRLDLPEALEVQRVRLRELTLRISWDGGARPAVWSPVGDFFGSSAGAVVFRTLPVGLRDDGVWYCHWPMPYAAGAEIVLENEGGAPISLSWETEYGPLPCAPEECLRFHAKWHRDVFPVRSDRAPDWTLLQTRGVGRFVGTQLHVWNPRGGWWGEGDEKFFVDGERFPSVFGTGTEDYLGYAWSSGNTFVQALHSQPVNENNRGHVSANRWHVPDDVPFQASFEGCIEKYFSNANPCWWAAVAYWYLDAAGHDPFEPVPVSERVGPWLVPRIWRAEDVIEAEDMPVLKEQWQFAGCPMDAVARNIAAGVLSGDRFMMWWVDRVGYRLELGFEVAKAGRFRVEVRFLRDREMGCSQFEIDGLRLGAPLDLYAAADGSPVVDEPATELGTIELAQGAHVFAAEVVGKNPASSGYLMAFDFIRIVRLP